MHRWVAMGTILVLFALVVFGCTNNRSESIVSDGDNTTVDGDGLVSENCPQVVTYDIESGPESDADATVKISNLQLFQNPNNTLSYYVEWTTDQAVSTALQVTCTEDYQHDFEDSVDKTSHQVFVMGLIPGADCRFDAMAVDENDKTTVLTEKVQNVGPVPSGLPTFDVTCYERSGYSLQNGWTLFNLVHTEGLITLTAVMVDLRGRYRWYYEVPTNEYGSDNDMRTVPEGVMIGGTEQKISGRLVNWEGHQQWKVDDYMHHHLDYAPAYFGENRVIYLSWTDDCEGSEWENEEIVDADTMVVYNPATEDEEWVWKICDYYKPEEVVEDWSHLNSISTFADGKSVLISSREQHALFKVSLETGKIEWKLGLDGDFAMADDDLFYRQHAAKVLLNGNILLFDNGNENKPGERTWSRAIEIAYDTNAMTAEVVWQYRPDPDIFAPIWSDADPLSNGNRLVTFGREWETSHIIEVSSDAAALPLWRLDTPDVYGVYRAERFESPGYGYVIEESK